ncbi:HAD family hydrolase [Falsirhodobacter deserti]|uniref:HAD family hydrolase n=1 Tax=Falsirhodobacter deserti TaxID=1365611 RepID=UPI000FE372B7|nr:HAD-IA family hydrolase [Falsirhodobacter deserti]
MPRIKALLFDLDGTLTHTDPIHLRAFQQLMADEGRSMDEVAYREYISGRSNAEIGLRLFPEREAHTHPPLLARKEALFRELAKDLIPLAGALELMDMARQKGMGLALVTNAPRDNVDHMLSAIGAAGRFDTIVYGDEMERAKPDPLPYLTALRRLQIHAAEALAFEDSPPGIQAAKAAGTTTIGIATTRSEDELTALGADLVVADFTDARVLALLA